MMFERGELYENSFQEMKYGQLYFEMGITLLGTHRLHWFYPVLNFF